MRLRQSVGSLHNETHRKGGDSTYGAAHEVRKESKPRASSARLLPTFSGRISQAFDGWITKGEAHSDEWAAVRRRSLCAIGHGSVSGRFIILRCLMQVGGSSGGSLQDGWPKTVCWATSQHADPFDRRPLSRCWTWSYDVRQVIQTSVNLNLYVLIFQVESPLCMHRRPPRSRARESPCLTIGQGLSREAFWLQPSRFVPTACRRA
jgi:hypothetical protein